MDVQPLTSDAHIILYVSGAVARSTVASTKCDSCREDLISDDNLPPVQVEEKVDYELSAFLDSINPGGLVKPTEFVYQLVVHCWRVFEEIKKSEPLKTKFLLSMGQRRLFCTVNYGPCHL